MIDARFVSVEVEPGAVAPEGLSLRYKAAGPWRTVARVVYETEDGVGGWWEVFAASDADARTTGAAMTVAIEDSNDGTAQLVVGGAHGLLLVHCETRRRDREPYLILSSATRVE